MSIVSTIDDKCKACYSCVRNCPVKAIKVELGQSRVVEERCISCGNCVRVCPQNAKQIVSYVDETEKFLGREKVVALLAPSFPASFHYLEPKEFFESLNELGFTDVLEVTLGIELAVPAYQEFLATNPEMAISSFCPAIVGMIERQFPSLLPYLAPVDSAVLAAAKYASWKYPQSKVVFIGPCIAKKQEMIDFGTGFLDAVLTFKELKEMFDSRGFHENKDRTYKAPEGVSSLPPLFPISGGLARNLDPKGILYREEEIAVVDGKEDSLQFLQNLNSGKVKFRFVDILLCKGCIDGPEMDSPLDLFSRKHSILRYAKSKDKDSLGAYPPFSLHRRFTNRYNPLPEPTSTNIKEILRFTNKFTPEDELNCGSCGYNTCQEKAVAVYQGLAEIDMCLPHLLEQSRGEFEIYKERLNFKKVYKENEQFLIGESQNTAELRRLAVQASRNDANILILGESGVGKEVFAHFTHFLSKRRDNPFIGINCTALPENLLESELFGYEEGAFTGAKKGGKRGKFEIAEGGTILLDEAGDMPLTLQAKLLRVLQEREFERVGGTRTIKLEARVMAATNRDLQQLVKEGKFRADLYYRLNVINIYIDSLRERKEDIAPLAINFLHKITQTKKISPKIFSEEALDCLMQYHWPGNVRELENIIERLLYSVEDNVIKVYHLPQFLGGYIENYQASEIQPLKTAVQDLERKMITQALLNTGNNRAAAANSLGIPRATFYLKLKEYGFLD
ncbi:sigma 54-interacting transcriptional regulator [Desulfosporosinus sp. BICA1-9]|uniref:sigma 54-interacting transcriptional regulator n=1 Tax=Desulfosporosinus sp. BICA1-9 TaxID=1531958 RepID=UPI00054C22FE|nr:sigma 54-interacting transcriptional regulator [Desulfosporosinus sp. BICA1-9]KJS48417.1 MAG: Fis family transcriptional regulator [Peptococcaceae bacterium BRH_c23]KJS77974.1 MAG: Fis family transcriptional regulator [Desulfosporosinus sp. BICA1-9]